MAPTDKATVLSTSTPDPWPNLPLFPNGYPNGHYTQLPGSYLANGTGTFRFILDGRRLRAFNGPGMGAVVSSITNVPNSYYGNFRYNAALNPNIPNYGPNTVGMDEDYDACDLENWFLAIQSADGQVIIPSFHRPGIDPATTRRTASTTGRAEPTPGRPGPTRRRGSSARSPPTAMTRRPSPTCVPDPATGKITYDVDNDADGITDSVWLDLGYPARPDASGQLYKPLFAFMVIGLNGRIPLNTAGNLAGGRNGNGAYHARTSATRSASSTRPMRLQNANQGPAIDADPFNIAGFGMHPYTSNTQVDNAGIDVRLTQLRNLLAGTRPQPTPGVPGLKAGVLSPVNGDNNFVLIGGMSLLHAQ